MPPTPPGDDSQNDNDATAANADSRPQTSPQTAAAASPRRPSGKGSGAKRNPLSPLSSPPSKSKHHRSMISSDNGQQNYRASSARSSSGAAGSRTGVRRGRGSGGPAPIRPTTTKFAPKGYMDLRSPVYLPSKPTYDVEKDRHARTFTKSSTFKDHWFVMKEKIKPYSSLNRAVDFKSCPRSFVNTTVGLPWITQNPEHVFTQQLGGKVHDMAVDKIRPVSPIRTPFLPASAPLSKFDRLFVHDDKFYDDLDKEHQADEQQQAPSGESDAEHATEHQDEAEESSTPRAFRPKKPQHPLNPSAIAPPTSTKHYASDSPIVVLSASSGKDGEEEGMTMLTVTYCGILEQSESYYRRQLAAHEERVRAKYHNRFLEMSAFIGSRDDARAAHINAEMDRRLDLIEVPEEESFAKLIESARVSALLAHQNEEVFPSCEIIPPGTRKEVTQSISDQGAFLLELRWCGEQDAQLAILAFDNHERTLVGTTALGEAIRCRKTGNGVARPWGAYQFPNASHAPGKRQSIEMLLHQLDATTPFDRFFVVLMAGFRGDLSHLRRTYLTMWTSEEGGSNATKSGLTSKTKLREHTALHLPCGDVKPGTKCVVLGSFLRHIDDAAPSSPSTTTTPKSSQQSPAKSGRKHPEESASASPCSSMPPSPAAGSKSTTPRYSMYAAPKKTTWTFLAHMRHFPDVTSFQRVPEALTQSLLITEQQLENDWRWEVEKITTSEITHRENINRELIWSIFLSEAMAEFEDLDETRREFEAAIRRRQVRILNQQQSVSQSAAGSSGHELLMSKSEFFYTSSEDKKKKKKDDRRKKPSSASSSSSAL